MYIKSKVSTKILSYRGTRCTLSLCGETNELVERLTVVFGGNHSYIVPEHVFSQLWQYGKSPERLKILEHTLVVTSLLNWPTSTQPVPSGNRGLSFRHIKYLNSCRAGTLSQTRKISTAEPAPSIETLVASLRNRSKDKGKLLSIRFFSTAVTRFKSISSPVKCSTSSDKTTASPASNKAGQHTLK